MIHAIASMVKVVEKASPVLVVKLSRSGSEKLGLSLRPNSEGTATIAGCFAEFCRSSRKEGLTGTHVHLRARVCLALTS